MKEKGNNTNDLLEKVKRLQQQRMQEQSKANAGPTQEQKNNFDFRSVLAESQRIRAEQLAKQQEEERLRAEREKRVQQQSNNVDNQPKEDTSISNLQEKIKQARLQETDTSSQPRRPLTEREKIQLRNQELLAKAKGKTLQNTQEQPKKKRRRLLILLLLFLLLIGLLAGGTYWVYVTWINPPSDGSTRVSVSIDGVTYTDAEITDFKYSVSDLDPGDKITNEIVAQNSFTPQDKGNWETVYIRYRVDAYYDGRLMNNLIHVTANSDYWYHYDKEVEDSLVNSWDGKPYCKEDDGWYYYAYQLEPKTKTYRLFDSIELVGENIGSEFAGQNLTIKITIQAMSTANHASIITRFDNGMNEDITIWGGNQDGIYDTEEYTYWSTCPQAWINHITEAYGG